LICRWSAEWRANGQWNFYARATPSTTLLFFSLFSLEWEERRKEVCCGGWRQGRANQRSYSFWWVKGGCKPHGNKPKRKTSGWRGSKPIKQKKWNWLKWSEINGMKFVWWLRGGLRAISSFNQLNFFNYWRNEVEEKKKGAQAATAERAKSK